MNQVRSQAPLPSPIDEQKLAAHVKAIATAHCEIARCSTSGIENWGDEPCDSEDLRTADAGMLLPEAGHGCQFRQLHQWK